MTARRGVGFGSRCLHHKPDGGVCMRRTAGGPCVSHVEAAATEAPPAPCGVTACALPAAAGGRYCRAHARAMMAG